MIRVDMSIVLALWKFRATLANVMGTLKNCINGSKVQNRHFPYISNSEDDFVTSRCNIATKSKNFYCD